MSDETKHAPDPLEPLREMIGKWQAADYSPGPHPDYAGELAAALPALEEAMAALQTQFEHMRDGRDNLQIERDELLRALGRKVEP